MRIPKGWLHFLSREIIRDLLEKKQVELNAPKEQVTKVVEELMLEELMAEDRLNEEVREMLKKFDSEIEKGHLDYRRLFELTKQKLVKERNIVL